MLGDEGCCQLLIKSKFHLGWFALLVSVIASSGAIVVGGLALVTRP